MKIKSYIDFSSVSNTLNDDLKQFLLFMSLHDSAVVDGDTIRQSQNFDYMGDGSIYIECAVSAAKINVMIVHNGEMFMQFEAVYSDSELDWVVEDELTLSNVQYPATDAWRAFEALSELTKTLESELLFEV